MPLRSITGSKSVTLQDIARKVGCSRNTVSLALRNSTRISSELREQIALVAGKLGYVPNLAARHLSTRQSGMIGVYTNSLNDAVRTELVNCLITELHTAEYRPVLGLGVGHSGPWHTSPWMKTFRELNVEAMVIVNETMRSLPEWHRATPAIFVGSHPEKGISCDYIALDRKEGAELGIEHLVARGHRNILIACSDRSAFGKGCIRAIRRAGLTPYPTIKIDTSAENERLPKLIVEALASGNPPTAAIFGDSPLAARTMLELQEQRIGIPDDLAVVGYDYFPWAEMLRVPLTTIEQPVTELASRAVRVIAARLADSKMDAIQEVLPHRLVSRRST